jgi:hypothetical protein
MVLQRRLRVNMHYKYKSWLAPYTAHQDKMIIVAEEVEQRCFSAERKIFTPVPEGSHVTTAYISPAQFSRQRFFSFSLFSHIKKANRISHDHRLVFYLTAMRCHDPFSGSVILENKYHSSIGSFLSVESSSVRAMDGEC